MKRIASSLITLLFAAVVTVSSFWQKPAFRYHLADRDEAVSCFLSNEEYFNNLGPWELEYRTHLNP